MNTKLTDLPVVRWFLPVAYRGTQGKRARRFSLYLLFNFVVLAVALPFTFILSFQLHRPLAGLAVLGGLIMALLGMVLIRLTDNLSFAGHWSSLALYLSVTFVVLLTGGIQSPAVWWYMLCPIFALLFSGLRGGFFWSGLVVCTTTGIYLGEGQLSTFSTVLEGPDLQWLIFSSFLGLTVCVTGYITAYRYFITKYQFEQLEVGQRKEREARRNAERANQAKSQFLANTSHEVRTPINSITGTIEVLRASDLTEEQRDHLDVAEASAHQLLDSINDILDMSRLEAGSRVVESDSLRVRDLLPDVLRELAPAATEKGLELRMRISQDVPVNLNGDEGALRQVLYHLVENAIRYTPSGHVSVYVDVEQMDSFSSRLRFRVRDTGVGIPEDEQERIFESFQRSSHPLMDEVRGTGIGLALSKNLVELLNGDIEVDSTNGKGSTIFFTAEFQLDGDEPETPSFQTDDLRNIRVLVYSAMGGGEDPILPYLREWGMQPSFVRTPEEVMAELNDDQAYDLLLLKGIREDTPGSLQDELEASGIEARPVLFLVQPGQKVEAEGDDFVDARIPYPVSPNTLLKQMKEVITAHKSPETENSVPAETDETGFSMSQNILFAEDNDPVRAMVTRQLENLGYEVTPVENGKEAVDEVRSDDYDAVLMDVQMPELDGIEATREIRQMEGEEQDIPIIALTAQALEKDRDRCLEAGMTEYLTKPSESEQLQSTIEEALSGGNGSGNQNEPEG